MKPRVLLISNNPFSDHASNGKTFKSFFSNYKKNEIAQIYFTQNSSPDFTFCDNYFLISDRDVLNNIPKIKKNTGVVLREVLVNNDNNSKYSFKSQMFNGSLRRILRDILWSFGSWRSDNLVDFVKNFNPNVIFFVGGPSKFPHDISLFIKKNFNLPLVVYFTDDYALYPKVSNIWDYIQKKRIIKFYRNTLYNSQYRLTVGSKMSRVYSLFFKMKFFVIMNSVQILSPPIGLINKEKLKLNYYGTLHTNRWRAIEKLGRIISKEFMNKIELNVYTTDLLLKDLILKFSDAGIYLNKPLFGEDLVNSMRNSDLLLHVESDDNKSSSLTKLSVSTKIPEYLVSGRPIIAFGPQNVASMELISDNQIGLFINSSSDHILIKSQLEKILLSSFRNNLGLKGYNYAVSNFDYKSKHIEIQTIFKNIL